jgi:opacity protein-like surface antigen
MRKFGFVLVVVACLFASAGRGRAQETAQEAQEGFGWDGVLYGGWSHARLSGSSQPFENSGARDGGTAGVGFVLRVEDEFGAEFGIRVTQKGADGDVDLTDYTEDVDAATPRILGEGTTALTYLELPLTFAGYLDAGQKAYIRGYLGISPNFLLSANFTGTLEGSSADEDIKDKLKGFDFAWVIGASATLDQSSYSLWLDARYVGRCVTRHT